MAATILDPSLSPQIGKDHHQHGALTEEIEGLIRVYKDGCVERPQIVPSVATSMAPEPGVTCRDVVIDELTNIWARLYVPHSHGKLPLVIYFHGGGFCVGSAAWDCYHDFLARLAASAGCLIVSVNYRLAPEHPLPAAYEDGLKAVLWIKRQALCKTSEFWSTQCDFSSVFLAGDSAGGNLAHNLAVRLGSYSACDASALKPPTIKGTVLLQPFFGGEVRTSSEKFASTQASRSALCLKASDTYWRLALPAGANRDHPWCNPTAKGAVELGELRLFPTMVCVSEMDILKDRNLEFCGALGGAGNRVETLVYEGVGHAFQVLNKSQVSQNRTREMIAHIKAFIGR